MVWNFLLVALKKSHIWGLNNAPPICDGAEAQNGTQWLLCSLLLLWFYLIWVPHFLCSPLFLFPDLVPKTSVGTSGKGCKTLQPSTHPALQGTSQPSAAPILQGTSQPLASFLSSLFSNKASLKTKQHFP